MIFLFTMEVSRMLTNLDLLQISETSVEETPPPTLKIRRVPKLDTRFANLVATDERPASVPHRAPFRRLRANASPVRYRYTDRVRRRPGRQIDVARAGVLHPSPHRPRGQEFVIYKIRTMIHNCESLSGPRWTIPGDPRVTPIGWLLRCTHIDELPQLLNVLRGEMSLIGPRPERPEFVAQLEKTIPGYRNRHIVLPGITGLAQVQLSPDTDIDSVHRKLLYDLHFVGNLGLWLDLPSWRPPPFICWEYRTRRKTGCTSCLDHPASNAVQQICPKRRPICKNRQPDYLLL